MIQARVGSRPMTQAPPLPQSVVLNVCLDTAASRLLGAEQLVCEVQLALRAFVAAEVRRPQVGFPISTHSPSSPPPFPSRFRDVLEGRAGGESTHRATAGESTCPPQTGQVGLRDAHEDAAGAIFEHRYAGADRSAHRQRTCAVGGRDGLVQSQRAGPASSAKAASSGTQAFAPSSASTAGLQQWNLSFRTAE